MESRDVTERPAPFKLERFFEKYEFKAPHLLCCSDCEPLRMAELLAHADADGRARWDNLRLSYTEPAGLTPLREAVASLLYGREVAAEQMVVCAPEEGVYLTMKALLRPGDRVVCCYPAYQSLYELALATGCALQYWEPSADAASGKLRFDLGDLEALLDPPKAAARGGGGGKTGAVKLVVVNFPHNPTGASISAAEQARLVAACRRAGAYLFSDEMYWRSEPSPTLRLPPAVTLYDRAVSLCGLSKSWALPGLRVGWVASRDAALVSRVAALKDYTTICTAGPSEVLGLIAVRATEALTARARGIIAENMGAAAAFFGRWRELFEFTPPDAGPIAFPRLKLDAAARHSGGQGKEPITSVDQLCSELVESAGVLLLPASVYDHGPSLERGHFRIGLGRKGTAAAFEAFEAFLQRRFPSARPAAAP